jgi:hypothetical protein
VTSALRKLPPLVALATVALIAAGGRRPLAKGLHEPRGVHPPSDDTPFTR